jgi:asparagine synthase (glutamine-hydrolysing)
MCGIAGVLSKSISEPERIEIVESMNGDMAHRGPDGSGIYSDSSITLGHRRLSIIDLDTGDQPMSYESLHIVFNGEIYNYKEVREELTNLGHEFRTNSDTEVIVHAFSEWGPDSVTRLAGMFAFALWDSKEQRLHMFRDRLGIKPLYYCRINDEVLFCSEISPLFRRRDMSRGANQESLFLFFMLGYSVCPETAFQDIQELQPGHRAVFSDSTEPEITPYWSVNEVMPFEGSFDEAREALEGLLNVVVKEHLVSDVPVSSFLSGGIDSSSITALSRDHYQGELEAFTVGFPDESYDESSYARKVADHVHIKHTLIQMDEQRLSLEDVRGIVKHVGEPFADSSCLPTYFVCKEARKKYKVTLSGDGADELFFGYDTFDWYAKIMSLRKIPALLRKLSTAALAVMPDFNRFNERLRRLDKAIRYSLLSENDAIVQLNAILDKSQLEELFSRDFLHGGSVKANRLIGMTGSDSPLRTMIKFCLGQSLPQDMLRKVDRMSMRASLEVRVPFLDHRVVEFAYSLPQEFMIKNGSRKYILREVMKDYLPGEVFSHKKHGFSIPLHEFYTREFLGECRDLLLAPQAEIRRIMPEKNLERILRANEDITSVSRRKLSIYTWTHILWMLVQYEVWAKEFNVSFQS